MSPFLHINNLFRNYLTSYCVHVDLPLPTHPNVHFLAAMAMSSRFAHSRYSVFFIAGLVWSCYLIPFFPSCPSSPPVFPLLRLPFITVSFFLPFSIHPLILFTHHKADSFNPIPSSSLFHPTTRQFHKRTSLSLKLTMKEGQQRQPHGVSPLR